MRRHVSKIKLALKIVILVGLCSLIYQRLDWGLVQTYAYQINYGAWVAATLLFLAQFFLLSWRWMILINIGRHRMNYPLSVQVTLASNIANLLLIPTIAGMAVRIAVAVQLGATLFKAIFATFLDRILTLTALSIFCAIFLPSFAHFTDAKYYREVAIFVGLSLLVVFVILPVFSISILPRIPKKFISKSNVRSGARYLTLLFNNNAVMIKLLSISLMAQLCFFYAVYIIATATGIELSFLQIMLVLPITSIVSSIPLSFGGWGVRESAFIYAFGFLGISAEAAFSTSVQVGILGLVAVIIAGIPALISGEFLKKLERKNV